MKRVEEKEKENKERWLLTYSDMITLLMIFFIVMYTISNVNAQKFSQLANSLSKALNSGGGNIIGTDAGNGVIGSGGSNTTVQSEEDTLATIASEISSYINQNGLQSVINDYIDERGLVISFSDKLVFDSGSAAVKPEAREAILKIGTMLKKLPNYIRVEGHTDDLPIHNSQFSSNWELSAVRAINVVDILINDVKIDPARLSIVGYGEYKPLVPNTSEANRQKNRRVDIVVMNSEYNKWEPNNSQSDSQ